MRITIIKSDQKGIKAVELGRQKLIVTCVLSVISVLGIIAATFYSTKWALQQDLVSESAIQKWQIELSQQKQELERAKRLSEDKVQALSSRLASMQAHILRLDAAGSRLAEEAGIKDEFGFGEAPAIGGPSEDVTADKATYNDVASSLDSIQSSIEAKEQQLFALESLLLDKNISAEQQISGRPVNSGWLSSPYGYRADPFTGKRAWHAGIDFSALAGSDVVATAAGVVTTVERKAGYGIFIEISHGDGYTTRYGHNKAALVKKGDLVQKGELIAKVGSTGRSTGPHVHYEITKNGKRVNPWRYLKQ
ncbi:M23 family metallopeptidase [Kangiella sediminilitoris]|uniref:Peptidase M23 n=1 Tax=Kangiella sediminilitoris TaxID=1144748 RepID=A0A1B3BCI4_9GAMM|nr:M23 family metallopeptidase [Kangiella sediminilitoris]AOE50457.1 Peptidase M23 [Kangiella sediminilitoris]